MLKVIPFHTHLKKQNHPLVSLTHECGMMLLQIFRKMVLRSEIRTFIEKGFERYVQTPLSNLFSAPMYFTSGSCQWPFVAQETIKTIHTNDLCIHPHRTHPQAASLAKLTIFDPKVAVAT